MRYLDEARYETVSDYANTRPNLNSDQVNQVAANLAKDLTGELSPPAIAATVNDFPLPSGVSCRLTLTGGAQIVTGFANVSAGRFVFIMNVGGFNLTLNNQDAGSQPQNRIITGTGAAITIATDVSKLIVYDGTSQRWRLVG